MSAELDQLLDDTWRQLRQAQALVDEANIRAAHAKLLLPVAVPVPNRARHEACDASMRHYQNQAFPNGRPPVRVLDISPRDYERRLRGS